MTVGSIVSKAQYDGDGATVAFPTIFAFELDADVTVIHLAANGTETTWVKGTQYTLAGAATSAQGTVTAKTSPTDYTPANGTTLTIKRDPAQKQETALKLGGGLPSDDIEKMVDRAVQMTQALQESVDRAITFAETSETTGVNLPEPGASKFIRWNSAADDLENADLATGVIGVPVTIGEGGTNAITEKAARLSLDFVKGGDLTCANALTLGADGNYFDIGTGVDTVTSIATWNIGDVARFHCDVAILWTHHSTNLVMPGGANYQSATGDELTFVEYASGQWRCVGYALANGQAMVAAVSGIGLQDEWIPAGAMTAQVTNGAASGLTESSTHDIMVRTFDFDTSTAEYVQFSFPFPKRWNAGTVTFTPYWTADAGSGTVHWYMQARTIVNDAAIDAQDFGTGVLSADTLLATGDLHVGPTSGAVTITSASTAGVTYFRIQRSTAGDTLSGDARLIGVMLHWTSNAGTDA